MKIRKGFVSNSSSSSFVCDVCHENISGMDLCYEEAEMFECENGHTVCEEHIISKDHYDVLKEADDEGEFLYGVPEKFCPICQFKSVDNDEVLQYLKQKYTTSNEEFLKEIKSKFKTYKEFRQSLK